MTILQNIKYAGLAGVMLSLQGCTGIFDSVYDEPIDPTLIIVPGQLYIDASDWGKWYYIDLPAIATACADNPEYNANQHWQEYSIPMEELTDATGRSGIYTYWYDVFGAGIGVNEFRTFLHTARQDEPRSWTIAVHRNNVRTNGCMVAATNYDSMDQLPQDLSSIKGLHFEGDRWSENEVWCEQSRMLLGLIGNQGIEINHTLSSWLKIEIPPMPPAFTLNSEVFILKLPDDTFAALQLENYQSPTGVKCCLTINYRYQL